MRVHKRVCDHLGSVLHHAAMEFIELLQIQPCELLQSYERGGEGRGGC